MSDLDNQLSNTPISTVDTSTNDLFNSVCVSECVCACMRA
uniref:Uncharacterized protein n=1 Tax=Anguilla anguilla TaxID=7936 RepID=A0A0E9R1P4_ANGAN